MIQLLDCTLRDGGYYTNWDFDKSVVNDYVKYACQLPLDYIEIGYRNPLKEQIYKGEYFHLDQDKIRQLKDQLKGKKVALMLDAKFIQPAEIKNLLSPIKQDVDLIRMAVNPQDVERCIELGSEIVKLGIPIAFNLMYISTGVITPAVLDQIIHCGIPIEFLYLVDSYGGATPNQVKELVNYIKSNSNFKVGFHAHNNLEMALANTIVAIDEGVDIIDATVSGMGRGAGNLKTELLLTYLLARDTIKCDMEVLGKLVDVFKPLMDQFNWGTNLPYMISGAMNIPQGTVMNWISTDRYSENDIVGKVIALQNDKLPGFSKIDQIDNRKVEKVMIIGGGPSVMHNLDKVVRLLQTTNYKVLITGVKDLKELSAQMRAFSLCISGKQIHALKSVEAKEKEKIDEIILPNDTLGIEVNDIQDVVEKCYQLGNISYPDSSEDSPLMLALEFAEKFKKEVELIGFDGYPLSSSKGQILNRVNQEIFNHYMNKGMTLTSLTNSSYSVPTSSIHAMTMN